MACYTRGPTLWGGNTGWVGEDVVVYVEPFNPSKKMTRWGWHVQCDCYRVITNNQPPPESQLHIADWKKIREHRQLLTDCNTARKNEGQINYDYQVGQKVLIRNDGILRKAESRYLREPWLITSVHTNGTIRAQSGNKSERMNIRRVKLFDDGTNI